MTYKKYDYTCFRNQSLIGYKYAGPMQQKYILEQESFFPVTQSNVPTLGPTRCTWA